MDDFLFNKEEYLNRIGFTGEVSKDISFIKAIQHAQQLSIPFENFDICLGREIKTDPASVFEKCVRHQRGGYCFELNGLFLQALQSFGFQARALLGRVHVSGKPTGRSHQVSLVTLDENYWILDTGFGAETPPVPIPLACDQSVLFEGEKYQLMEDAHYGYMLRKMQEMKWKNLYSFDLNYVCQADIAYGNYYTSTNPHSFFVNGRIAALRVKGGVVSLYNNTLKKKIAGSEEIITLDEGPSYMEILEKEFGIFLDAKYTDLKPVG